jgi:hypothetical protein
MEPELLLAQLRALFERVPDFEIYSPTSRDHMIWLGQAHALVSRWSRSEATPFQLAADALPLDLLRDSSVAKIYGIIQRAIADLELTVPDATSSVFKAGEVYDVFRALNEVIGSAEKSIFIIDPYLDDTIFSHYLNSRKPEVKVRLLLSKNADQLKPAAEKYKTQFGEVLEVKRTRAVHDRVIFIDGYVCWVLGQSLSHAAQAKPTYLNPLSPDVIPAKLEEYDRIWSDANEI